MVIDGPVLGREQIEIPCELCQLDSDVLVALLLNQWCRRRDCRSVHSSNDLTAASAEQLALTATVDKPHRHIRRHRLCAAQRRYGNGDGNWSRKSAGHVEQTGFVLNFVERRVRVFFKNNLLMVEESPSLG